MTTPDPRTVSARAAQRSLAADRDEAARVLTRNRHLNFVQRIVNTANRPSFELPDGSGASHYMASADNLAYPTIVQLPSGELQYLSKRAALDYALKSGEFIRFKSPEDADWFASNGYKNFYANGQMPPATGPRIPAPPDLLRDMGFSK